VANEKSENFATQLDYVPFNYDNDVLLAILAASHEKADDHLVTATVRAMHSNSEVTKTINDALESPPQDG
jgi:hypothetical protein